MLSYLITEATLSKMYFTLNCRIILQRNLLSGVLQNHLYSFFIPNEEISKFFIAQELKNLIVARIMRPFRVDIMKII